MNRYLLLTPIRAMRISRSMPNRIRLVLPLHRQTYRIFANSVVKPEMNRMSIPRRIKRFLDENPFTQIALLVCVLVVGVASLVEWTQNRKRASRFASGVAFPSLPTAPFHPVFAMQDEVALIMNEIPSVSFSATRVVSIVGERGSGKTELARQTAEEFLRREKRFYRRDAQVITLDLSSRDQLSESLLRVAALLHIPHSCMGKINSSGVLTDEEIGEVLSALNQRLKKKQVVCIIDSASCDCIQKNAMLFSTQHWSPPSLFIITSRQPIQGSVNLQIKTDNLKLDRDKLLHWIQQFGIDNGTRDTLANIFSSIPNNFEAFSLICHSLANLNSANDFTDKGNDLQSIVASVYQQLPKEIKHDVDCMGFSNLNPLQQLQLITLLLFSADKQLNQHSVDLLAKLRPTHALPLSTLIAYLESPFLELEEQLREVNSTQLDHGSEQKINESEKPESEMGYWEFIKHTWKKRKEMLEALKQQQQPKSNSSKLEMPTALESLKQSPLFHWEYDASNGFESVKFSNSEIHKLASGIFLQRTIPQMEETAVSRARSLHASSLLSKLSTFNPTLHLIKYRSELPGVSRSMPVSDTSAVHTLSLLHRITQALVKDFEDGGDHVQQKLISQHGDYLLRESDRHLHPDDRVRVLRLRAALLKFEDNFTTAVSVLREAASIQESNQSTPLVELARTYSQLGRLSLLLQHTDIGHAYYEQAANLYERAISKLTPAQQVEYGSLLYRYGVEMSYEKKLDISKVCLEKSLAVLNLAVSQAPTSIGQSKLQTLVLSSMVELAHVYLALGAHSYAEKLLTMAETMSRTVGGSRDNPDLAQLYNLKAILRSLMGDKQGYVQMKQQAGDVLATVEDRPFVY